MLFSLGQPFYRSTLYIVYRHKQAHTPAHTHTHSDILFPNTSRRTHTHKYTYLYCLLTHTSTLPYTYILFSDTTNTYINTHTYIYIYIYIYITDTNKDTHTHIYIYTLKWQDRKSEWILLSWHFWQVVGWPFPLRSWESRSVSNGIQEERRWKKKEGNSKSGRRHENTVLAMIEIISLLNL